MGLTIEEKKKTIALIIWSFINSLFIFKYSYRVSLAAALTCTAIYNIAAGCLLFLCSKRKISFPKATWPWMLAGISVMGAAALYFIPVESIRVDRWEMIQLFWDSVHEGIYPYAVHSPAGNYPGPMPFYFILSYPFYLIQEIGWMGIIAVWLVYLYIKNKKLDKGRETFVFAVLLLSVTIYYEIITRSTILLNSIIFLIYFLNLENIEKQSKTKFYLYAFLGGIIFSTRNIFVIPMILWGIKALLSQQISLIKLIGWCLCFALSFALTFVPFIISDTALFIQYNPFITQGEMLIPFEHILVFIFASFVLPLILREKTDLIFLTMILFFIIISYHVIYAVSNIGSDAFLYSGADISYYIFCFPFILEILTRKEYDK